ncbi:MAG: CHASE domain-containing protein, partial [Limnobacter sp.]|nr:CHASE domain-containing protein [Limnobacter sp.]
MQVIQDKSFRNAAFVAAIGLLVSVLAYWVVANMHSEVKQSRFDRLVSQVSDEIARRVTLYQYGVRGARGSVVVGDLDHVPLKDFRAYSATRDPDKEFPGARGFGFIRRVVPSHEASFLANVRADRPDGFSIRSLGDDYKEKFVIQLIEPEYRNRQAVGLDIASESNRRNAAILAAQLNRGVLTHPITLVQASGAVWQGFLFLMPVYETLS